MVGDKKKTKSELYKPMKGRANKKHSTKVIPNKKKSNTEHVMVIQFDSDSTSSDL